MAHGPKRVEQDDSGRIFHVYMDEQVDAESDLAVQLLDDGELQHEDERGDQNVVILDPNDPLAVQTLEEPEHPMLVHLQPSPEEAIAAIESAEAADAEVEADED